MRTFAGSWQQHGYDDLKVIEAKKFLVAVTGERRNSTVDDGHRSLVGLASGGGVGTCLA
jgi:hypothetical protein